MYSRFPVQCAEAMCLLLSMHTVLLVPQWIVHPDLKSTYCFYAYMHEIMNLNHDLSQSNGGEQHRHPKGSRGGARWLAGECMGKCRGNTTGTVVGLSGTVLILTQKIINSTWRLLIW